MNNQKPIVLHRKIIKQGSSFYIAIPPDWLETHKIDPEKEEELLIVANEDMLIVNPKREKEVYKEISKLVQEGKYREEKDGESR
jgi:antitoxin component of MazEF toxin-antitoxin module